MSDLKQSRLYVAPSNIHGNGLFTRTVIAPNIRIVLVADLGLRNQTQNWITQFGSLVNHSKSGNTYLHQEGNYFYLYSLRNISAGEELTSDYTKAPACFNRDITGFK